MILYFALFRLGFPSAPYLTQYLTSHHTSNSPDRSTKSTTSHLNVLCLLVNIGFQVLFHSPPGVLFNFPSRYCFTIGHQGVFSLTGWSPLLPTGFLVSCRTLDSTSLSLDFTYGTFTLFGMLSQNISVILWKWLVVVLNPKSITTFGLGSSAFARHYLQNRLFSFFSCGYLDVSVPHVLPLYTMYSYIDTSILLLAGFPIRTPMINSGYLLLIMAFRSLSRPSSPLDA